LKDIFEIPEDVLVREADDTYATRRDDLIASLIVTLLILMDTAVNLDDEAGGMTVEVGDESIDHLLPTETRAVQSTAAHPLPEPSLGRCHLPAKLASALPLLRGNGLTYDDAISIAAAISHRRPYYTYVSCIWRMRG
jgi:hypothetical protein